MKRYDLIIVGAGPSGLSAAIEAAKIGLKVVVFDENEKPVEQFAMSGAKIKFIYNDDGSITELKLGPGGEEISRVTNYFDEDKNLIKEDFGDYFIVYEHEFF